MSIQEAVSPVQKVSISELSKDFADRLAVLTWGQPGLENDDKVAVSIQLKNALMQNLSAKERLRLTCTPGASMNLATSGHGTVLSGGASDDVIIETDEANGQFDLEVTYTGTGAVTVIGGVTQGSNLVACGQSVDLTFT